MSSESTPRSAARIVRILLLLLGALMILYAISDHPFYGGEPGFGRIQLLITAVGAGLALSGMLLTRIAGRVLLLAITSLIMLAFAEIAGEFVLGPRHRPIYQTDEKLIFKFIPNRSSVTTRSPLNGNETVTHRINSAGFRGDELRPPGEAVRVVVYGDSFVHASYSFQEETFVARLGALLAGRLGRPVEAINAGVSSYGPDQIVLKMEDELPKLQPDLIVVAVFAGNDYGDLMRNKMFRLGSEGALVENHWQLDRNVRQWLELNQRESILVRALRNTLRAWFSPPVRHDNAIEMDVLLDEAQREYRSYIVERDDVVTNTHVDYYSADISLTPHGVSARYKIALMQAVLHRIRDVAARNGVALAFLFIPHPMDVTEGYDIWKTIDRKRFPDYDGRNQIAPLETMARSLGVPFLSLYGPYRAHGADGLYFRGADDHWNAAGQRLAATLMAEMLLKHGLPPVKGKAMATSESAAALSLPPRGR